MDSNSTKREQDRRDRRHAMIETLWSKVRSLQIVLEQAKMINDTSGAIEAEMRLRGAALLLVSSPPTP